MPATAQIAKTLADHEIQFKYTFADLIDTHLRRGLLNFSGDGTKTQQSKIKLNAKLCGLNPSFQNIDNHSMSDIKNAHPTENSANQMKLLLQELP